MNADLIRFVNPENTLPSCAEGLSAAAAAGIVVVCSSIGSSEDEVATTRDPPQLSGCCCAATSHSLILAINPLLGRRSKNFAADLWS